MNEYVLADKEDLTAIADAVRTSTGSTDTYNVSELSTAAVSAIANGGGTGVANAVLYTEQDLSLAQRAQARSNINAAGSEDIPTALPNPQALTFTGGANGTYDGSAAKSVAIPTKLPNPNALTFTGGVTGTYDGSSAKTINIPEPLLSGDTSTVTPTQVLHAIGEGRDVAIEHTHAYYGLLAFTSFIVAGDLEVLASSSVILLNGQAAVCQLLGNIADNTWSCEISQVMQTSEMPTALPNPNALTFTGAVEGTYDGSSAKTINIPTAFVVKAVMSNLLTNDSHIYSRDKTMDEIFDAVSNGLEVVCELYFWQTMEKQATLSLNFISEQTDTYNGSNGNYTYKMAYFTGFVGDRYVQCELNNSKDYDSASGNYERYFSKNIAYSNQIPSRLPNTHPITFTGQVNETYDGSQPITIPLLSNWKYMENKPFGPAGDVVPRSLTIFDADCNGVIYDEQTLTPRMFTLIAGKEYEVCIDYESTICTCVELEAEGIMVQFLGNLSFIEGGDDTGENFIVMSAPAMGMCAMMSPDYVDTQAYVSITSEDGYKALDDKYLSDNIVRKDDQTFLDSIDNKIETSLTAAKASGEFDGAKGDTGVGISKVTQTYAAHIDDEPNVVTISLTDNTSYTFEVQNGSKGTVGANGLDGKDGADGADGYTPVKGVDYWTNADQEAIVQQVIAAMGTPVFGQVDENNNIILTGNLANEVYTLKYEDTDGNLIEIGTLAFGSAAYTNLADPTSSDWQANKRINSSGSIVDTSNNATYQGALTNYIPCVSGDVVRIKGLDVRYYWTNTSGTTARSTAYFYGATQSPTASVAKAVPADDATIWSVSGDVITYTVGNGITPTSAIQSARFCGTYMTGYDANNVIITVNEEIV